MKSEVANFAGGVKKKHDDSIIFIDDLHLQSNLTVDVLEYLRMWNKNGGHYNVPAKSFDSLSNLKTLMTFDLKYGIQSMKSLKNIDISQNRYTYYCHSIYIPPLQRNKMRRILQGIISYRLDLLYDHPLNGLHIPLVQSMMTIDDYFRKNISKLKHSQLSNPNTIFTKKRLLETLLTRALDKEEDIDSPSSVAQLLFSLTHQFYLLRVLSPAIKSQMHEEIQDIIVKEFKLDARDIDFGKKDRENLAKVIKQHERVSGMGVTRVVSKH